MLRLRASVFLFLLGSLVTVLMILAWALGGHQVVVTTQAPLVLTVEGQTYPLFLGQISLTLLFSVSALFFYDMVIEFFGARIAFGLAQGIAAAIISLWFILQYISFIPFLENATVFSTYPYQLFDMSRRHLAIVCATASIGFTANTLFFHWCRKLTRNVFTFFRIFVSKVFGVAVLAAVTSYLTDYPYFDFRLCFARAVTIYLQYIIPLCALIPLFYILKLFIRIFIGSKHCQEFKAKLLERKPSPPKKIKKPKKVDVDPDLEVTPLPSSLPSSPSSFIASPSIPPSLQTPENHGQQGF